MDGIEQAIRRALAKGDADDRTFREKVYRSAFAALDRSLKEKPELTVENAIKRRKALQATVKSIETEYVPALAPRLVPEPVVERAPGVARGPVAPDIRADAPVLDRSDRIDMPQFDPDIVERRETRRARVKPARPVREKRRGGRLVSIITGLVIVAVLGVGAWWAYANFGGLLSGDLDEIQATINERTGQSGPPPLSADGADPDQGWTTVFRPEDIQLVQPAEDASAEAMEDDAGAFMQIRSGQSGAPVVFSVGESLLEGFAGNRVVFDIVARGIDGEATQMSVECDFGAMGDCGRTRYDVGAAQENYLFEVALPNAAPGRTGTIAINTDVEGQGRGVDIFAIRARLADNQ